MDLLLVSVTIASLALAVTMSGVAWRLLRRERRPAPAGTDSALELDHTPMMVPRGDELERTSTEAEAETDADEDAWDLALRNRPSAGAAPGADVVTDGLDGAAGSLIAGRKWLGAAALVLLGVAGVATTSALRSPEIVAALAASRGDSLAQAGSSNHPLELLSLRHSRESDGAFTVSGLVQNPDDGRELQGVEAVVYLFDANGQYFARGRAALGHTAMAPGDETPFAVRVEDGANVGRYRVGFRLPDGNAVAHVDHRAHVPSRSADADGMRVAPGDDAQPASAVRSITDAPR